MIHTHFQLQALREEHFVDIKDLNNFPLCIPINIGSEPVLKGMFELSTPIESQVFGAPVQDEHWLPAILDRVEQTLVIMQHHSLDKMRQHIEFIWDSVGYTCNLDVWYVKEEKTQEKTQEKIVALNAPAVPAQQNNVQAPQQTHQHNNQAPRKLDLRNYRG